MSQLYSNVTDVCDRCGQSPANLHNSQNFGLEYLILYKKHVWKSPFCHFGVSPNKQGGTFGVFNTMSCIQQASNSLKLETHCPPSYDGCVKEDVYNAKLEK